MEKFEDLVGKILTNVENNENTELVFTLENGEKYRLFHSQDCCETVTIIDIVGSLEDLIKTPILLANESTNKDVELGEYTPESNTWTFYNLATINGYVTIRWYGKSNGYYSESVDWEKIY